MPEQDIHTEVGAYVLGSLEEAERARFEAHLAECERCRAELVELREVAELLGEAEAPAPPPALRDSTLAAVAAEAGRAENGASAAAPPSRPERAWGRLRVRPLAAIGAAAALAAGIAIVAVLLPSGSPGAPTVGEAAELAALPDTVGEVTHPEDSALVDREGSGVPFPNWHKAFGWKASGGRDDALEGREATTTFYEQVGSARNVAYTIVSGAPLEVPAGAGEEAKGDRSFFTVTEDGRAVVVFERLGHTCVLSGEASEEELVQLAAWAGGGRVPF